MINLLKYCLILTIFFNHHAVAAPLTTNPNDYITYQYPSDHWSRRLNQDGTGIAIFTYAGKYHYYFSLNPTDRRGYRTIVRYIGEEGQDIQSSFNRAYSATEQRGLLEAAAFVTRIYKQLGLPIAQMAEAGNNTQYYDENTKKIQIGNTQEPSMLHLHLWGRGVQTQEYISGVALQGPKLGVEFEMGHGKSAWNEAELKKAVAAFRSSIDAYVRSEEFKHEFGGSIVISKQQ